MGITSSESGNTVTIQVAGRFDFGTHQDFMEVCKSLPQGEKRFVVDLAGTEYLDSSALGMLLQLRQHAKAGETIEIKNGNEGVREILRVANFDKLFRLA
jgi:anti-anti-sigma factor